MRHSLIAIAGLGMCCAGAASGAVVSFAWSPGQGASGSTLNIEPNGIALIDVAVTLLAGESVSRFRFRNAIESCDATGNGLALLAGWQSEIGVGLLGSPEQFVEFRAISLPAAVAGPGAVVLGRYEIHAGVGATPGFISPIVFDHSSIELIDAQGIAFTYNGVLGPVAPTFYSYGVGSPAVPGPNGQPADPLLVHIVPAPGLGALAAMGLLALGARRRK